MNFEKTVSNKGQDMIIFHSFKYRKFRVLANQNITWRCSKATCYAMLETNSTATAILKTTSDHNHDECSNSKLQKDAVRKVCKKKAVEDLCEKPSKLIRTALMSTENTTGLVPSDIVSIRQCVYEQRRKLLPRIPKCRSEALEQLKKSSILTSRGEQFCFIEDEIVILTCQQNLDFLSAHCDTLLADGTFYVSPQHFYQLYTIHAFHDDSYIQLIFCVLPNKETSCYEKMWLKVLSLCKGKLCPKYLILDFEKAAHVAATKVFPNVQIRGCRFHIGQNWFRQLTNCGLRPAYNSNKSEVGSWLKLFFGLPFCDPYEVSDAFVEIINIAPRDERALKFADYILETYVMEGCPYPPELWAEKPSLNPRTNNAPESFHRHLKCEFYCAHPHIHLLIEKLKQFQSEVYLKIQKMKPKRVTKADKRIEKILKAFNEKYETDIILYLREIKYICQPSILKSKKPILSCTSNK
ncbi:hypothetical protein V9T40_000794 [Parthenolecanium corni]|uniref:MULE transposase domain-containing protein n=1 Tax=Parthenolecanium corni TaxID=536013 RepID=A0AAN9Y1Z4_9HEMI